MKRSRLYFLSLLFSSAVFSQNALPGDSIKTYVDFLKSGTFLSPKEYILEAFREKDIVVLSERLHPEYTQYEMIVDILRDPHFKGNLYTEVGVFNLGERINKLLVKEGLPADSANEEILQIIRNLDFFSLWENTNYYFLVRSIYEINQERSLDDKILLFPLDVIFDWDSVKCNAQYRMFMEMMEPQNNLPPVIDRNAIMAKHFISVYADEKYRNPSKKKALVIMNTYHGYTRIPKYLPHPTEPFTYSTAEYIYKTYPTATKGIMINGIANSGALLAGNGKWDAAFEVYGNKSLGFDLAGTPFGATRFDMYNFGGNTFKTVPFEFIFDGFVFYTPLKDFQLMQGIPGVFNDPAFTGEYIRRVAIEENMTISEVKSSIGIQKNIKEWNAPQTVPLQKMDDLNIQIGKWITRKGL